MMKIVKQVVSHVHLQFIKKNTALHAPVNKLVLRHTCSNAEPLYYL